MENNKFMTFIAMLLLCSLVLAADITVPPGLLNTVNSAVVSAVAGDVVIMQPGIYTGCITTVLLNKNITLIGTGAVIDCEATKNAAITTSFGCDGSRT